MATWEDGPEYAPHQRPDLFQPPEQAPALSTAVPPAKPSAGAPLQPPVEFRVPQHVAPLETLVPRDKDVRDPHQAFAVVTSTLTEQSATGPAWTAAHSSQWSAAQQQWGPPQGPPVAVPPAPGHDPHQPFAVGQGMRPGQVPVPAPPGPAMPAPGTDQWFAPTSWAPPAAPRDDRTLLRQVVQGTSVPLLVVLGCGLIPMLSPFCVALALALTALATRRRRQLRTGLWIGLGVVGLSGLMGFVDTLSFSGLSEAMQLPAVLVCLVMLVFAPIASYLSIQAGEPEQPSGASGRDRSSWD
ncbi:hypothetical protein GC722_11065 [Auraticoccus sp. F435]|uniref:Uncharacterized protein n=1 Tax=Auraticoccus cholistanensis TaxID=2656650 RepID=A0A6A9UV48_9ACTN|nr:hypothetical protein [Auraticoccus cholistanensis]MVA76561.1 hypothetical protein [Auraticoccus cholistanensis]